MMKLFKMVDLMMLAVFVLGGAYVLASALVDTRTWIDVRSVNIPDTVSGEQIVMNVDREVHYNFTGTYNVVIRKWPSNEAVCTARETLQYRSNAALPDPMYLSWWAQSSAGCGNTLPEGRYIVDTCHTVENPFGILPDQTRCLDSNVFTVAAAPEDIAEKEEVLQMQIDTLRGVLIEQEQKVQQLFESVR